MRLKTHQSGQPIKVPDPPPFGHLRGTFGHRTPPLWGRPRGVGRSQVSGVCGSQATSQTNQHERESCSRSLRHQQTIPDHGYHQPGCHQPWVSPTLIVLGYHQPWATPALGFTNPACSWVSPTRSTFSADTPEKGKVPVIPKACKAHLEAQVPKAITTLMNG